MMRKYHVPYEGGENNILTCDDEDRVTYSYYDGDVLNVMYITNKAFYEACNRVLNPRNSMQISRNDGKFNGAVLFSKDSMINANSMIYLSRNKYSAEQLERIKRAKMMD